MTLFKVLTFRNRVKIEGSESPVDHRGRVPSAREGARTGSKIWSMEVLGRCLSISVVVGVDGDRRRAVTTERMDKEDPWQG